MKRSFVAPLSSVVIFVICISLWAQEEVLELEEARLLRQWQDVLVQVLGTPTEEFPGSEAVSELKDILSAPSSNPDPRLDTALRVLATVSGQASTMRTNTSRMQRMLADFPEQPLSKQEISQFRRMVREEIERLGERAASGLIRICREKQEVDVRLNATMALAKVKAENPEASRLLLDLINDSNTGVQYWAIKGLGLQKEARAGEPLLEILDGNDELLKDVAVWALGEIEERRAVSPLMDILLVSLPTEVKAQARALEFKMRVAEALRKLTGEDFGYIEAIDEEGRTQALDSWRSWWEENRRSFP
jgi:hypothetical protein